MPINVKVKQGCPLSPTLFGLYIDALEAELLTEERRCGGQLCLAVQSEEMLLAVLPLGLLSIEPVSTTTCNHGCTWNPDLCRN